MPLLLNVISLTLMLASCSSPGTETSPDKPVEQNPQITTVARPATPNADKLISKNSFGKITIGMPVSALPKLYPNMKTEERPVYEYGVDGETMGILLYQKNKPYLYLWTMKDNAQIHGMTALSPELQTSNGLKVGSTVAEILTLYPAAEAGISYVDDSEFIYIPELGLRFEFLTSAETRIGEYENHFDPQPEFRSFRIKDRRVDRISIP